MTQYLQSHIKLPLDVTRYSLGRVEFEIFSRLGEHAPRSPRRSTLSKKEPPPAQNLATGLIYVLKIHVHIMHIIPAANIHSLPQ